MRSSLRFTAALVLSAYLLTGGTATSWVLCFGADGHVTVEITGSACCQTDGCNDEPAVATTQDALLTDADSPRGCGGCTDIPLLAAGTARAEPFKVRTKDIASEIRSALLETGGWQAVPPPERALAPGRPAHHSDASRSHLRTTVLRC